MSEFEKWSEQFNCEIDWTIVTRQVLARSAWNAAIAAAVKTLRDRAESDSVAGDAVCCACLNDARSVTHAGADAIAALREAPRES